MRQLQMVGYLSSIRGLAVVCVYTLEMTTKVGSVNRQVDLSQPRRSVVGLAQISLAVEQVTWYPVDIYWDWKERRKTSGRQNL